MSWDHNSSDPHTLKTDDTVASEGTARARALPTFIRCLLGRTRIRFKQTTAKKVQMSAAPFQLTYLRISYKKVSQISARSLTRLLRGPTIHTNRRHDRVIPCKPRAAASSPFLLKHQLNRLDFKPAERRPDRHRLPRRPLLSALALTLQRKRLQPRIVL